MQITRKLFKQSLLSIGMICGACENRKHYDCIDCMNDHKTYLCNCDCHDEKTPPHSEQAHNE